MTLAVALVFPELLGTYGDRGNAVVLVERARWRGIDATLVEVPAGARLPDADIYCLGGGEDGPERRAAESLRDDPALARAVAGSVPILGVCGGYQILGRTFPAADGTSLDGVGVLDVETVKGAGPRAVGEVLAAPAHDVGLAMARGPSRGGGGPVRVHAARGPVLTGFENHAGLTRRGPGVAPLGTVLRGVGNGDGTEGAVAGRVVGTYLHGPVLARNPALADLLLAWATGDSLGPLDDREEQALRAERVAAASRGRRRWWDAVRPGRPSRSESRSGSR